MKSGSQFPDVTLSQATGPKDNKSNIEKIELSARSSGSRATRNTKAKISEIERPPILIESYSGDSRGVKIELIPSSPNINERD